VHDAFEIISSVPSRLPSLMPRTTVLISLLFGGAERITLFAPAVKCCDANSLVKNLPVDSITMSIFNADQGRFLGSLSLKV